MPDSARADIQGKGTHGESPLHFAVLLNDRNLIAQILQAGGDIEAKTDYGATPLFFAVSQERETFDILVKFGANIFAKEADGTTLLHEAAGVGREDITEFLLKRKLNPNAQTEGGDTPFHAAVWPAKICILKILLSYGGKINLANKIGEMPIHRAVEMECLNLFDENKDFMSVLKFLLTNGANVNAKTVLDPPIHFLQTGIPSKVRAGDSPLSLAKRFSNSPNFGKVEILLRNYGAKE